MKRNTLKWILSIGFVLMVFLVVYSNNKIERATKTDVYSNVSEIPSNKAGLLLGTSKYLNSGKQNQYFENRITATVQLFKAGKIKSVVISGDNGKEDYNEPQDMKDDLVKQGVPPEKIYLDHAGFRTFDSVYRIKAIFGQSSFTIISQEFHTRRAVYIAKSLHLQAIGYNAKDVDAYHGFKTIVREKFARVKVFIDLAFGKKPKFLGEKIEIK